MAGNEWLLRNQMCAWGRGSCWDNVPCLLATAPGSRGSRCQPSWQQNLSVCPRLGNNWLSQKRASDSSWINSFLFLGTTQKPRGRNTGPYLGGGPAGRARVCTLDWRKDEQREEGRDGRGGKGRGGNRRGEEGRRGGRRPQRLMDPHTRAGPTSSSAAKQAPENAQHETPRRTPDILLLVPAP